MCFVAWLSVAITSFHAPMQNARARHSKQDERQTPHGASPLMVAAQDTDRGAGAGAGGASAATIDTPRTSMSNSSGDDLDAGKRREAVRQTEDRERRARQGAVLCADDGRERSPQSADSTPTPTEQQQQQQQQHGYAGGTGFGGGAALTITKSEGGYIYIEFPEGDPSDPMNWSRLRKFGTLFCTFLFASSTAINGTGYNSMQTPVMEDFGISRSVFLLGNTLYLSIGVAFTPLLLAPLSEIFGRLPIFLSSALIFALLYIPAALTPNIYGFLLARLFQGCVASVGNSMVGGTVSDIFASRNRGKPMSCFALLIYFGQAVGPSLASYTVANPHMGWRWVFGWQGILGGAVFLSMLVLLRETRGPVLLSRRAREMTKADPHGRAYRCSADDERVGFWTAVKISLARPAWWLVSEPIVLSFSLWIGFLWGCVFLLLESVPIVFEAYGWSDQHKSLVLLTLAVGGTIAFVLNTYNEKLYARALAKAAPAKPPPEARLYFACIGACLAPIGFFIFAWTGRSGISPAGPIIGLVVFVTGTFWIYLAVFVYIAEVYEYYASSGLAAQSWLRNVLAGTFPLFAPAMYNNLTPPIASTILGVISAALGVCPFLLYFFGPAIRKRSRVAQALAREEKAKREKMEHERERNAHRKRRQEAKDKRQAVLRDTAAHESADTDVEKQG